MCSSVALFGVTYYVDTTTKLDLSYKNLTSLPAEIGNSINLQILNLYNNKLTSFPAEIGNLINLQKLNLYNNKLTSLPVEIGNLINLQTLWLNNNQLTSLPVELLNIKNKIIIDDTSYDINNLDIDCKYCYLLH